MPLVVEKAGQRYHLDLVDDSTGIDLNITKVETTTPELDGNKAQPSSAKFAWPRNQLLFE